MKKILFSLGMIFILLSSVFTQSVFAEQKITSFKQVVDNISENIDIGIDLYLEGDTKAGIKSVNVAYFKFYEKKNMEPLSKIQISGKRVGIIELLFSDIKKGMGKGLEESELREIAADLVEKLYEDADVLDGNRVAAKNGAEGTVKATDEQKSAAKGNLIFWGTFGLTVREGLEAILVLAAIIAYLVKTNNHYYVKQVYIGSVVGIIFSVILAIGFNMITKYIGATESGLGQELFEGIAMFLAVIVLFWVSNWMISKSEVAAWTGYIQGQVEKTITKGSAYALVFSAFLAVAREGAELILFLQTIKITAGNDINMMWYGLVAASALLIVIFVLIRRFSVKLPIKQFFFVTSILMFAMCIIFLGKGIHELQEADIIGITIIESMQNMNYEWMDWVGLYNRYETLIPQIILLIITIITMVIQSSRNKKIRQKLEEDSKLNA